MTEIQSLHKSRWQPDGDDWLMIVGNRTVAALQRIAPERPNSQPWFLSFILAEDIDDFGWSNVGAVSLESAKHEVEQWWHQTIGAEAYKMTASPAAQEIARAP